MELTQEEIKWIKDRYAEENSLRIAVEKDKRIQQARENVAKKYESELMSLKDDIEGRKIIIEKIALEADEAERNIIN